MDRNAIFWAGRLAVGGIGIVLMFGAIRLLGRARAAASWPTAPPVAALARPLGWTGIAAGMGGLAGSAALSLGALAGPTGPALTPQTWRAWLLAAVGALVVVLAVGSATGRLVNRAELAVLIRTRSGLIQPRAVEDHGESSIGERVPAQARPDGPVGQPELSTSLGGVDPIVPSGGQPGWVYQDPAGDWYLAVATGAGQRLVRLRDFALVPAGVAGAPLTLRGSVEISVFPVAVP
jgi:hypothetical protein